jgi:hypothetical protein
MWGCDHLQLRSDDVRGGGAGVGLSSGERLGRGTRVSSLSFARRRF